MTLPCGCCLGIQIATREQEASRPGLTAISYRAGTYTTIFETMLARLSNLYIDVPAVDGSGSITRVYPLNRLTTRDSSDPSIALLDAWAVVADVLTFYEERIANEGYLPTARERRSILELARLIGYRLRPGVAASVYLAFTVSNGFQGVIPAGTRAQSLPGPGQTTQYFETSVDLTARDTWNQMKPRLTRPQVITLADTSATDKSPSDPGTDARTRDTIYLEGVATNLKQNDALLFVLSENPAAKPVRQRLRLVKSLNAQADQNRTEAVLQDVLPAPGKTLVDLQTFIHEADSIFSDSDIAASVSKLLKQLSQGGDIPAVLAQLIPEIQSKHDVAVKRKFTRLEPWLAHLLDGLNALANELSGTGLRREDSAAPPPANTSAASGLQRLVAILDRVAAPPSVQPANEKRLSRSVAQAFSSQTDIAPRLLAAFRPSAASTIYDAWSGTETPTSQATVHALRVKAALFPGTYPGQTELTLVPNSNPQQYRSSFVPPSLTTAWGNLVPSNDGNVVPFPTIALDGVYDKIVPESWVAIDRPVLNPSEGSPGRTTTYHRVQSVLTVTMAMSSQTDLTSVGFTAKVTQLTLTPPWFQDTTDWKEYSNDISNAAFLHGVIVYAQSELLDLAEEPLDTDVEGNKIDLDGVYEGFESGRWVIVSGERTDIPDTTGVIGNELVMLAAVSQGTDAPGSATTFPAGFVPFLPGVYVTDANQFGDRVVVGILASPGISGLPLPDFPNQLYQDQVQLAPGLYVTAYVPSASERTGSFQDFAGLLVDPTTGVPYPNGTIDAGRLGQGVFAWRISTQPVHTMLTFANGLAYTYDTPTVNIYGNVVNATHGQTVGEVLGDGDATQPFDTFTLHQKPLTYVSAATPDGAASTLVVRVNEIQWQEQPNLAALGPRDRSFITQTDDSDQTCVIFGNGQHGSRVPTGSANIKATYRYGIGSAGNVDGGQISQLATHPLGAQGVINPLAASGGADRDSLDQARRNAPVGVMALDRLVSVDDYAEFARTYAGIGKASALRLSDGFRQIVHVTIAGAGDIPINPNSDLYRNLVQSLLQFGDPSLPLQVCVRKVQLLVISANVQVLPEYAWENVEPQIRAALLDLFSFENRALGQSAFLSEAVAAMQGATGVSYVDVKTFDAVAEDVTANQLAGLAATLNCKDHVLAHSARLNPNFDPSTNTDPCQRILPAELVFLTPDIAETLILNPGGAS